MHHSDAAPEVNELRAGIWLAAPDQERFNHDEIPLADSHG
jgi:hypothetical protein